MAIDALAFRDEACRVETTGTVLTIGGDQVQVWTGDGTVDAKRAVSCLVAPAEGDLVLLARLAGAEAYILAVLERPRGQAMRIALDGDLTLDLPSGRFDVAAAEGVNVESPKTISFAADRVEARAREGGLFLGSVKLIAGAVDSVIERLSQSAKRVFRRVDELDRLRAGQIDYTAERTVRLHGEHTLVTARQLVKADGQQIHIG